MSTTLLWAVVSPSHGTGKLIRFPGGARAITHAKPKSSSKGTKNSILNRSSLNKYVKLSCSGRKTGRGNRDNDDAALLSARCGVVMNPAGQPAAGASDPKVVDVVDRHVNLFHKRLKSEQEINEAYEQCGKMCAEQDSSFYLGTLLTTPEKRRALWSIAVWCRRTDELVDGPNASSIPSAAMDRWEARLEDIFEGRPADIPDAALSDTVAKFAIDIQPFRDMIEGMKMDLKKSRYENFEELYLYSYHVAGTVGLMTVPVMGIETDLQETTYNVFNAALALGTAFQLTNILRDVGEDARRGRIYLPQDELSEAGISDEDIFAGKVTDKWRNFMKEQIVRAGFYYDDAEKGIARLSSTSRWPVWASLLLYRKILDEIEANDYNSFTRRANVSKPQRLLALFNAYAKSVLSPPRSRSSLPLDRS